MRRTRAAKQLLQVAQAPSAVEPAARRRTRASAARSASPERGGGRGDAQEMFTVNVDTPSWSNTTSIRVATQDDKRGGRRGPFNAAVSVAGALPPPVLASRRSTPPTPHTAFPIAEYSSLTCSPGRSVTRIGRQRRPPKSSRRRAARRQARSRTASVASRRAPFTASTSRAGPVVGPTVST